MNSKAIVLGSDDFGEADRYVHFLSEQWGMITVLAKSAKKSKRRYVGGLDLFCHDEIFIKGNPRKTPYLQELTVLNSFSPIRERLERLLAAGKAVHWIRKLLNPSLPVPLVYKLLGQTLALIAQEDDPERLQVLALIFELKLLEALGLTPQLERCTRCGKPLEEWALFDWMEGGMVCSQCTGQVELEGWRFLDSLDRRYLRGCIAVKLSQWNDFPNCPKGCENYSQLILRFAEFHTNRRI